MRLSLPCAGQTYALMMGESVSATKPEISTATASVKANSLNNTPVKPDKKPIGAYTAASVMVMPIIGATNWCELASAASMRPLPSRMCRATFSTTTIASSTTKPTDNTIASTVSKLSEKPMLNMAAIAPSSETGIVTNGTSAVRAEPIKANTTMPTNKIVSASV